MDDIVVNEMDEIDVTKELAQRLSSKRVQHSIGVSATAVALAEKFGYDKDKARMAGLLHDLARELSAKELLQRSQAFGIVVNDIEEVEPILLHAPLAAKLAKQQFGIDDEDILRAISLHTIGGPHMTLLDKIIYVSDAIEPNRDYKGVDTLRKMASKDLDKALLAVIDGSMSHIIKGGALIHPDTLAARNQILLNRRKIRV